MENKNSELRKRANLGRDVEGQTDMTTNFHGHLPSTHNFDFSPIYSFICQVAKICRLIYTYKRRVFGLFFLVLETGAAVLDGIGKGKLDLLLAAFVLSTISFLITLCAYAKRRPRSVSTIEVPAVSQLRVVELVFSSIQFIASLLQLLLAHLKENKILDVKNNIDASVFPVAFAMVAVVFIFKNDGAITNSSQEGSQQQVTGTSARNEDSPSILDMKPVSSSDTVLPANNVPQEGFQQPVKVDVIGTLAGNEDSPSILDIKPESSSDTVLPANNVPQEGFQQPVKVDVIGTLAGNEDSPSILDIMPASSSDTVLPANNVPQECFQQPVKVDIIGTLAGNEDSPSILDIMPASSSDTVLPANNVPQAVFRENESSSATRLRAPSFKKIPPKRGQIRYRYNIFGRALRSFTACTHNPHPAHKSD